MTGTTMAQLPDAGITPPDKASEDPPLVMLTVPPQVLVVGVAEVFLRLVEGYVSLKAAPVIATALGLVSVMVRTEAPFISIVLGLKSLAAVGGASAVRVAVAAAPGNAFALVTTPVLFKYVPAAVAVTGTTMEQLPEAGMDPLDRLSELPPLNMLTVPPQVLVVGAAALFFMSVEG